MKRKRRVLSILFVLVLVLSFSLVPALPVAAEPANGDVTIVVQDQAGSPIENATARLLFYGGGKGGYNMDGKSTDASGNATFTASEIATWLTAEGYTPTSQIYVQPGAKVEIDTAYGKVRTVDPTTGFPCIPYNTPGGVLVPKSAMTFPYKMIMMSTEPVQTVWDDSSNDFTVTATLAGSLSVTPDVTKMRLIRNLVGEQPPAAGGSDDDWYMWNGIGYERWIGIATVEATATGASVSASFSQDIFSDWLAGNKIVVRPEFGVNRIVDGVSCIDDYNAVDIMRPSSYIHPAQINDSTLFYPTIQAAIDSAIEGDAIEVSAGTYEGTVTVSTGLDNLILQGDGSSNTVLADGLKLDTTGGDLTGLSVSQMALKGNAETYGEGVTVGHTGNDGYVYDLSFDCVLLDGEETVGMAAYIDPLAGTFSFTNGEITGYEDWGVLYLGGGTLDAGPDGPSLSTVTVEGTNIHHNKGSSVVYGNKDNFTDLFVFRNNDLNNNGGHAWFWAEFELRNVDDMQVEGNGFDGAPVGMEDIHGAGLYLTNDNNGLFNGDITHNNFTNNLQAIYVYSGDVSGLRANFNNFLDNDIAIDARGEADPTGTMDAANNWWGNASGPADAAAYATSGYEAYGDAVSTYVDYEPWLLEEVASGVEPPTYDKTLALKKGWTLVSADKRTDGSGVWIEGTLVLKYTPTGGFVEATSADLGPLTAIYVKTDGGGGVGFDYAEVAPAVYAKELEAGWNLISILSTMADTNAILSPLRYVTIGTQQGVGLATLVSQGIYNQFSNSFYLATLTDTDWSALVSLDPLDGYWAYMNAAKTFEVIPVR